MSPPYSFVERIGRPTERTTLAPLDLMPVMPPINKLHTRHPRGPGTDTKRLCFVISAVMTSIYIIIAEFRMTLRFMAQKIGRGRRRMRFRIIALQATPMILYEALSRVQTEVPTLDEI